MEQAMTNQAMINQKRAIIDQKKLVIQMMQQEIKDMEKLLDKQQKELWIENKKNPVEILLVNMPEPSSDKEDSEKTKKEKK